MAVKAYVVHHAPGRIRLRIPERRHHASFFADLQERLSKCANVTAAEANPLTGGILVRYTGEIDAVVAQALSNGLHEIVDIEMSPPPVPAVAERVRDQFARIDDMVKRRTAGEVDARSLAILGLLGTAFARVLRGDIFGPAIPLLWYASQMTTLPEQPRAQERRSQS
jgi:hypothetical protein